MPVDQRFAAAADVLFKALRSIASGEMPAEDCRLVAEMAIEEAKRAHAGEMAGEMHASEEGDRVGMPDTVLLTLTVMDDGEARVWKSDRVQGVPLHTWLHGIVSDCAQSLVPGAIGPSGMN